MAVEFTRQSQDGRLTLVIEPSAHSINVLWSVMTTTILEDSVESLRKREVAGREDIGSWEHQEDDPRNIPGLSTWARSVGASAVIWTALPSRFNGKNHIVPNITQALKYLKALDKKTMGLAEYYIRKAPIQIQTTYRKAFELEFGWEPEIAT